MPAASTAGRPAKKAPQKPKAASVNGAVQNSYGTANPYGIMASRIANRVAEMAENITFVEREKPSPAPTPAPQQQATKKKPPRKLEIRLPPTGGDVSFSAPFLDNTLSKMLALQNRMLKVSAELAEAEDVSNEVKQEQFAQSAELSRIIALICAEKARQGA